MMVAPETAAANAGLLGVRRVGGVLVRGDVILGVGDAPTRTRLEFLDAMQPYKVGDTVTLTIDRGGQAFSVDVTLQPMP
jgi:S1-C subfamily serine protease